MISIREYKPDFFTQVHEQAIPFTNKFHVLKVHVPEFVRLKQKSLGPFSEQSLESVHLDFNKHIGRFYSNTSKSNKIANLKRTVVAYNSNHFTN